VGSNRTSELVKFSDGTKTFKEIIERGKKMYDWVVIFLRLCDAVIVP
jgi:hypothetical protein